jgi:hypothetical protein
LLTKAVKCKLYLEKALKEIANSIALHV